MTNLFLEVKDLLKLKGNYRMYVIQKIKNTEIIDCCGYPKEIEEKLKLINIYDDSIITINIIYSRKEIRIYYIH